MARYEQDEDVGYGGGDDLPVVAEIVDESEEKSIVAVPIPRAELDVQVATAKQYPRDLAAWRTGVLDALAADPNLAAVCTYSVKKGGSENVTGPSIRMAILLVSEWTNLRCRILQGRVEHGRLTARCEIWDLERNQAISTEESRSILKSARNGGGRYGPEMIENAMRSAMAFAVRSAVFKIIPERLWRPLWHESQKIAQQEAAGDLPERRKVAVSFCVNRLKVMEAQICARLGVSGVELIDAAKLVELKAVLEAIKSKATTIQAEFMDDPAGAAPADPEKVAKAQEAITPAPQAPKPSPAPAPTPKPAAVVDDDDLFGAPKK
jgi:hypothetical protein